MSDKLGMLLKTDDKSTVSLDESPKYNNTKRKLMTYVRLYARRRKIMTLQ